MMKRVPPELILKTPTSMLDYVFKAEKYWTKKLLLSQSYANALNRGRRERADAIEKELDALKDSYLEEAGMMAYRDIKERSEFVYGSEPFKEALKGHPAIREHMEFVKTLKGILLTYQLIAYGKPDKYDWFPTKMSALRDLFSKSNTEGAVFYDLGSGDGRAPLLASSLGAKRAVGLEVNEDLHKCALQFKEICESKKLCKGAELLNENIFDHDYSDADLVFISLTKAEEESGEISKLLKNVKPSCKVVSISWPLDERLFGRFNAWYAPFWDSESPGVAPVFVNQRL